MQTVYCRYAHTFHRLGVKMDTFKTAEDFCRFIWHKYFVERRYDIIGELIDPEISVIGTGSHEISRNIDEFLMHITRESAEWNGSFIIKDQWYQTTRLSDSLYLVMGELGAKENGTDGILFDIRFRFSVILRETEEGFRIVHVHQSVPDPNQALDEFFPHRMLERNSQQIIFNLRHDTMTGLLNRLYLTETVNRYIKETPEGRMLMLDVDNFKVLNDKYGHPFGDKVLILLSRSLNFSFPNAAAGRIGGDEFVVYLPGRIKQTVLEQLLQDFKKDFSESQKSLDFTGEITVSIGVSQCPVHGNSYEAVWKKADEALYQAKRQEKNNIVYLN